LNPLHIVVFMQTRLPQGFEETCPFPLLKTIMDG